MKKSTNTYTIMKDSSGVETHCVLQITRPTTGEVFDFLIDVADIPLAQKYNWAIALIRRKKRDFTYAKAMPKRGESYQLHRLVTSCPNDLVVDHINGDTTNNMKENLRVVTSQQNSANSVSAKGFSYYSGKTKPYRVSLRTGSKNTYIGYFATESEARLAYVKAKEVLHQVSLAYDSTKYNTYGTNIHTSDGNQTVEVMEAESSDLSISGDGD